MIVLTLEPGEAEKLAAGRAGPAAPLRDADRPRAATRARPRPSRRAARSSRRGCTRPSARRRCCGACACASMAGGLLDDPELIAAAARDAGLDPASSQAWCATSDVEAALRGRHRRRARPVARGARARPQARRPARAAPLHGAELRAAPRRRRRRVRAARLQPGRGLRDGDREPRAGARAPAQAGVGRGAARLGRRAARDGRGRRSSRRLDDGRRARAQLSRVAAPTPAGADCYWSVARALTAASAAGRVPRP